MSVRAYNPSVRVGNWNEDLCLEEVCTSTLHELHVLGDTASFFNTRTIFLESGPSQGLS